MVVKHHDAVVANLTMVCLGRLVDLAGITIPRIISDLNFRIFYSSIMFMHRYLSLLHLLWDLQSILRIIILTKLRTELIITIKVLSIIKGLLTACDLIWVLSFNWDAMIVIRHVKIVSDLYIGFLRIRDYLKFRVYLGVWCL